MKYLSIVLCILIAACGPNTSRTTINKDEQLDSAEESPTPIAVKPIQGYFVKNTVAQTDSITCWVISNEKQQDSILAVAKTMTNKIDTLDFANNIITAVMLRPSELSQDVRLTSSVISENEVHLHFAVKRDTPKRTFTAAALWMGALPKTPGIKAVRFYNNEQLMRTIPVTE